VLGYGIHYTAERTTVLGLKAGALYLNFLDEIGLEALPDAAICDVCGVDAIDQIDIFAIAGSVYLEAISVVSA
jgi:hypothetical protein